MMDFIEDKAMRLGKNIITLGVDGDNDRAIKMYKNSNELEQMGRTGRALALEKYNWNKTAFATKQIIKRLFLRQKVHEANICKIDNKGV